MPRTIALLLALAACSPRGDLVGREAPWWDPDRLATEQGLELARVSGGAPIGYWPRAVVRADGTISLDNRAWVLGLPAEVYRDLTDAELRGLVVEVEGIAAPPDPLRRIEPLLDAANRIVDHQRRLSALTGHDLGGGEVAVIADGRAAAGRVVRVIATLAQAQLGAYAIVGREETAPRGAGASVREASHLRFINATGLDADGCVLRPTLYVDGDWRVVVDPQVPPLTGGPGCLPAEPGAVLDGLNALVDRCAPLWAAAAGAPPAPRAPWACAAVVTVADEVPVARWLAGLSMIQASGPRLQHHAIAQAVPGGASAPCSASLDVAALTDAQLAVVCDAEALGGGRRPSLFRSCASPESRAAFPAWTPPIPDCLAAPPAVEGSLEALSELIRALDAGGAP